MMTEEMEGKKIVFYAQFCGRVSSIWEKGRNNGRCCYKILGCNCANIICQDKWSAQPHKLHGRTKWTTATIKEVRRNTVIIALVISTPLKGEPLKVIWGSPPPGSLYIIGARKKAMVFIGQTIIFNSKDTELRLIMVQRVLHGTKLKAHVMMMRVQCI